jgi:3-methyl-2-oxobutanoate hydroxymethyltransferase
MSVCGHIGYTPQTVDKPLKKYHKKDLLVQAKSIEASGAKMIILSMTGDEVDELITNNVKIPTISFRSSFKCNGAVEILYDLLGISNNSYVFKNPKFKNNSISSQALLQNFIQNIKEG